MNKNAIAFQKMMRNRDGANWRARAAEQMSRGELRGLAKYYDDIVSVEETGSFKPDAKVYRFVAERLNRPIGELRLVATHDWDTHGALTAGMLAAYIDRSGAPYHPLYRQPDVHATTMGDLVERIIAEDSK